MQEIPKLREKTHQDIPIIFLTMVLASYMSSFEGGFFKMLVAVLLIVLVLCKSLTWGLTRDLCRENNYIYIVFNYFKLLFVVVGCAYITSNNSAASFLFIVVSIVQACIAGLYCFNGIEKTSIAGGWSVAMIMWCGMLMVAALFLNDINPDSFIFFLIMVFTSCHVAMEIVARSKLRESTDG